MQAIILAAGQGLRMGKITADRPRCLLDVGDETVLERQIRILNEVGIPTEDITLVAGYRAELLEGYGLNIIYNPQFYCTDNAYSLGLALDALKKKQNSFLIIDGDLVFEKKAILDILSCEYPNCALVQKGHNQGNSTGVYVNKRDFIHEIGKHINNSELTYSSIMKIDVDTATVILPGLLSNKNRRFWYTVPLNCILQKIQLKAVYSSAVIRGINTSHDYMLVKEIFGETNCKILITGASGFLGKKLCSILERNHKVIGISKRGSSKVSAVDVLDYHKFKAFIELNQPNVIIHTAAFADPEICDANPQEAYALNVESTQNLCEICKERDIKLIFISTDYVFDGDSYDEYYIDSERRPKNYYGKTKVIAEDAVQTVPNSLIVRIPIIYGYNDAQDKKTFVTNTLFQLTQENDIYVDNTQIRYPVLIDEIAVAISRLLDEKGIVQISSSQPVTKFQWANLIAETFELDGQRIHPKTSESNNVSPRPMHTKMNTDTIDAKPIVIHNVENGLEIMRKQMNCIFKLIYKSKSFEKIYGVTVGDFRYDMGKLLAKDIDQEIIAAVDCVVPVPNSGLFYAMGLAQEIRKPYLQALVKIDNGSRSFNIADLASRSMYLRSKIVPIAELARGKKILLIDEAIFTGITLRTACDILKACGTKEIHICIPTPVCYSRCEQYIQPDRAILSEGVNADDMTDYFGVESVTHIPYAKFISRIQDLQDFFCYDCFKLKQSQ